MSKYKCCDYVEIVNRMLMGSEGNVRLEMAMSVTINSGNVFEGCLYFRDERSGEG